MRLLLDTHVLIWWWNSVDRLREPVREMLEELTNEVFVSAVSAWEIANKVRLGKLDEMRPYIGDYSALVVEDGFRHLPIDEEHGRQAGLLAGNHRDPFDRIIATQALIEDLTVVTRDAAFVRFGCKVIW